MGDIPQQEEARENHLDPIAMVIELQREMETLKRKGTYEIRSLKEHNTRQQEENTRLRQRIETTVRVETERENPEGSIS